MIERRQGFRFPLEALQALAIGSELTRQDLQGNLASERRISGEIDLSHASGTELLEDLIVRDRPADQGWLLRWS